MTPAMLSEDAAEAANKDVRFIEEHRSFQSSDQRVLNDTFRYLLRRSDPIIQASITYPDTYHTKAGAKNLPQIGWGEKIGCVGINPFHFLILTIQLPWLCLKCLVCQGCH